MSRHPGLVGLLLIIIILAQIASAEDYRWIITYPYATNDWNKKVGSNEHKVVLKAQFIKITPGTYTLNQFAVRPTTDHTAWLIDSLQLWMNTDNYPGSLDHANDLQINTKIIDIPAQTTPTTAMTFTLPVGDLVLSDTTTFFVTMHVMNWFDENSENPEITNQHGRKFGIAINQTDLAVDHGTANQFASNSTNIYQIWALNLPVVIYNKNRSAAEDNIRFYLNYIVLDGSPASQQEILTDYKFTAYVRLDTTASGYNLSYASFKIRWNNNILQLDTMRFGSVWNGKESRDEESGFGEVEIDTDPQYSLIRFEGLVVDDTHYVEIAGKYLAEFDFKVLKPGISPLILSEITVIDQWGIPYHIYQKPDNDSEAGTPRADAWAKFILGDLAASISGNLYDGMGDAQVNLTDISLFSNYIWLNPDSADWYERFDIGSPGYHDPDELSQDDTTNFYDLMVIGTNYFRSHTGQFAQKRASGQNPLTAALQIEKPIDDGSEYNVGLDLQNLVQLASAQFKLRFNPAEIEFLGLQAGELIQNGSPKHLLIYHEPSLTKGIIDINFLALTNPLSGDGEFITLRLRKLTPGAPILQLESADCRDIAGQQITMQTGSSSVTLPEKFPTLTNYPNPFNATTVIRFNIPLNKTGDYTLQIYDLRGSLVRILSSGRFSADSHSIIWDGKNQQGQAVVSGLYLVSLKSKNVNLQRKIILMR